MKKENINNKVEEMVENLANDYFSTSPNYRGKNALKILVTDALTSSYEQGVKDERERIEKHTDATILAEKIY